MKAKEVLHEKLEIILDALREVAKNLALIKTSECLSFQQLEDYVKGRYTGEEFEKLFDHETSCPYCRRMVRKMRRIIKEREAK